MDSGNGRICTPGRYCPWNRLRESKISQQLSMLLSPEKFIFNRVECFNLFWNVIVFIAIQDFEMSVKSGWRINHVLLLSRGLYGCTVLFRNMVYCRIPENFHTIIKLHSGFRKNE